MPKKILILYFHPRFEDSRVNRKLITEAVESGTATVRDMYELYPDFNVDVEVEKSELLRHDIIIWQHPFYWYNCPPLMKQWIDLVLEYGWAYGKGGDQLQGKWIMNVVSSGGTFEVYRKEGRNRFTYRELLSPFDQTAFLCHMEYLPPYIVPGANKIDDDALNEHALRYKEILHFLQRDDINLESIRALGYFNDIHFEQWQEQFCKMH
jgi:glutathione-regulated potassium-efflux system ancillary protein KefG